MSAGKFEKIFAHFWFDCPVCSGRRDTKQNLPESEVAVMYTGQKYTRADVISLLFVISALSKRIATRMQMADEKGGSHVKDERLIPDFG